MIYSRASPSAWTIQVGTNYNNNNFNLVGVKAIRIHPSYRSVTQGRSVTPPAVYGNS